MSLPTTPEPPRDKLDTTILIVQGALGAFAAIVGAAPFVTSLSPEFVIVTIAVLLGVIAVLAMIKSRHSVQKYKIYAESWKDVESAKSWDASTRVITQNATAAGMDRNVRFAVYQNIISTFEKSTKEEGRKEEEKKVYAEVVTRLKDMQQAVLGV